MKYYYFLLLCLGFTLSASAQSIQWNGKAGRVEIEDKLQFWLDQTGTTTLENAQNQTFEPFLQDNIPEGKATFWLRCAVRNTTNEPITMLIGTSLFDYIDFYMPDPAVGYKKMTSGRKFPNVQKEIRYGASSFGKFSLKAQEERYIYLHIRNDAKTGFQFLRFSPALYSDTFFNEQKEQQKAFNYIFLGIVGIMILYNLLLFFSVKDTNYFLYVIYSIALLFFVFSFSGDVVSYFYDTVEKQNQTILLSGILGAASYFLFAKYILRLAEDYPFWNKNIYICEGLLAFSLLMTLLDWEIIAIPICFSVALWGYTSLFVLSFKRAFFDKYTPAIYFFIANAVYFTGLTISIFQMLNILPTYLFGLLSLNFTELGVGLELAFASLGLGTKINLMREELSQKQLQQDKILIEEEKKRNELILQKNAELEEKVKERTHELRETNEELVVLNEEMKQQSEEILAQRDALEEANIEIFKQHSDIVSSITYARRIQTAILPKKQTIAAHIPNILLFYKPKDIVSGDFYWFSQISDFNASETAEVIFAIADCTGHGVPGAFMTVIGSNLLDQIINKDKIFAPEQILNELDIRLLQTLKQQGVETDKVNDGMDISILRLAKNENQTKLTWASAKRPLWIFESGKTEPTEYKGNKFPIGSSQFGNKVFTQTEILLQKGDTLYTFTDGYADQFGKDGKFKIGKFRDLLSNIHKKDFETQSEILGQTFGNWKGAEKQTDDVLVVGIKN